MKSLFGLALVVLCAESAHPVHGAGPGIGRLSRVAVVAKVNPADLVGLNPQPLPPKSLAWGRRNSVGAVMINPQPLPPKVLTLKRR